MKNNSIEIIPNWDDNSLIAALFALLAAFCGNICDATPPTLTLYTYGGLDIDNILILSEQLLQSISSPILALFVFI